MSQIMLLHYFEKYKSLNLCSHGGNGLLDGLLVSEELHGHHRLHVLIELVDEGNT